MTGQDPVLAVLAACEGRAQPIEGGFKARCPAHQDRNPSLKVATGQRQWLVDLRCFAGCSVPAVRDALLARGVPREALGRKADAASNGSRIDCTYQYCDEQGTVLFATVRFTPKDFRQRHSDGNGGHVWNLKGVRRVLYRLPEVRGAVDAGRWVVVVEGEKDADRLARAGIVGTCSPMGAGKWNDEYAKLLAGAKVAVLPDNDDAGRDHGTQVARSVKSVASSLRMVELPGLPDKGDVSDWLEQGHSADELKKAIEDAPEWEPKPDHARLTVVPNEPALPDESGESLADDLHAYHARWVTHTFDASVVALTLWGLHAHAIDAFDITPRLYLKSAEMRSGKTQALTLLSKVVPNPMDAINLSESALFRLLSEQMVTLLHDEADATFGPKAREREDLRALLNGGWEVGAKVWRTGGSGREYKVEAFPSFCPVALAGIGDLPMTVRDRAITIPMKRRKREDRTAERFRRRDVIEVAKPLHDRSAAWAARHIERLRHARPDIPDELNDRAQDAWETLLAVADEIGGRWPQLAREAARTLSGEGGFDSDESISVRLLIDIRSVFYPVDDQGRSLLRLERITSAALIETLTEDESSPWGDWKGKGRPISPQTVAWLLSRYRIKPKKVWFPEQGEEGRSLQGYEREWFEDDWTRYVEPSDPQPGRSEESRSEHVSAESLSFLDTAEMASDQGSSDLPTCTPEGRPNGPEGDEDAAWDELKQMPADTVIRDDGTLGLPDPIEWTDPRRHTR